MSRLSVLPVPASSCPTAIGYTPEALADQVDWSTLPGAADLAVKDSFNMFAGYINIDQTNGRRIFYWFMEAQQNAMDAPVVSGSSHVCRRKKEKKKKQFEFFFRNSNFSSLVCCFDPSFANLITFNPSPFTQPLTLYIYIYI